MTDDRKPILQPYVRQSRARPGESEETSLSLDQQEESIRAWGEQHGYRVARAIRDHDETGRSMDRPGFAALRAAARPGVTVAVWKYDRLARNLIGQEQAVVALEAGGAAVVSITEPPGKLPRQLLGSIAEYYSDQLSERMVAIRAAAARAGKFTGATPPYGYRRRNAETIVDPATGAARVRRTGPIEPDPDAAPVVRRCFERVAAGEPVHAVVRDLHAQGIPSPFRRAWSQVGVRRMLENPFYRGVVRLHGAETARGAHEPLVDEALWFAVQDRLATNPRTRAQSPYPVTSWLEGTVRHACGHRMYLVPIQGKRRKDGSFERYATFVCGRSTGTDRCGRPSLAVSARKLEAAARACLAADLQAVATLEDAVAAAEAAAGGDAVARRREELVARRRAADARRARARELWLSAGDSLDEWEREQARHRAAVTEIDRELAALPAAPDPDRYRAAAAELAGLRDLVAQLDGPTLGLVLRTVGTAVVANGGVRIAYRAPFDAFVAAPAVVGL